MSGGAKLLVVDDDDDLRETVGALLEVSGYRVALAPSGRAALDQLATDPLPDAILLDLMMPGMNGWQFRDEQRKTAALAKIPVVVVTASRNFDPASLDPAAIVYKPFSADALVKAVTKALDG